MTPSYLRLIQSDRVNPPTRGALKKRADVQASVESLAVGLCPHDFSILYALVQRLIPSDNSVLLLRLTRLLGAQRLEGTSDGWRFADMPPDEMAFRAGLTLLESTAFEDYGAAFEMLSATQRDDLISRVQRGDVSWPAMNPQHWFEDLLADTVEIYMSDPNTLERINFTGFAFLPRWQHVGLNSSQAWELPTR